jgi:uncharacterized protein (UPF0297 family)
MINLVINYITEISTITSTLSSGLLLPLIYFSNPLNSTLSEQLKQVSVEDNKYNPQISLLSNLSKGISAYDARLQKEREEASKVSRQQIIDDLLKDSLTFYERFLSGKEGSKEDYLSTAAASNRAQRRRLCRSRKARFHAKKMSNLSLFGNYHPGGKN